MMELSLFRKSWCIISLLCILVGVSCGHAGTITHLFTFDKPMSWADDVVPWGLGANYAWDISDGGNPGKALRVSSEVAGSARTFEIRTLQFNHKPGTKVRVDFDTRIRVSAEGAFLQVRYFDGYCGGDTFTKALEDSSLGISAPAWDSRTTGNVSNWQKASFSTGILKNTVLTLAFIIQVPASGGPQPKDPLFECFLDNLKVETTPLDQLMDLGFDWHGIRGGSTSEFRWNTMAANSDWCDFADQEDVVDRYGDTIHYTLLQHRDASSTQSLRHKSELLHETKHERAGGMSALVLSRYGAGSNSAVSWGVRQTVSYEAIGLKPNERAAIRVSARLLNSDPDKNYIMRSHIGVDPLGGVITKDAKWTREEGWTQWNKGWREPVITFKRPEGAQAFTIYVRMRDGMARLPSEPLPFAEPASMGTPSMCESIVDWMKVEVIR